jgi:AbrB family looped-hinge helix DNA binding protein
VYVKARVTSKYQITLPKPIRQRLGIEEGDEVVFEGRGEEVVFRVEKKIDPVEAIEGILAGEEPEELRQRAAGRMLGRKLGL